MLSIVEYGSEGLRAPNQPVEKTDADFQNFLAEMAATLHKSRGVGLAAPQVGKNERFFITEAPNDRLRVFVNPKIVSYSVETASMEEGCLSVPGVWGVVERPAKIVVEASDEHGAPFSVKVSGYLARIIQHEYDHLQGILFVDHLDAKTQDRVSKRFLKKQNKKSLSGHKK